MRLAAWYGLTGVVVWTDQPFGRRRIRPLEARIRRRLVPHDPPGRPGRLPHVRPLRILYRRRAPAPVKEMVARTRRLSAKAMSERLPVANPHDELGELATVFNATLQQVEDAFAELRRFTADVSHELRTPLTAMRAVGEVALREGNSALLNDALGSMLEEVRRMNQMIERLLLLARADVDDTPASLEAALVRPVLIDVGDSLLLVAEEKRQQISIDCPDHLLAVFDPALLRLALINLTQNAIRYRPPGKAVCLRALANEAGISSRWPIRPRHRPRASPEDLRTLLPRSPGPLARRGRRRSGPRDCQMVGRTHGRLRRIGEPTRPGQHLPPPPTLGQPLTPRPNS